jgi:hypothetical protein
LVIVEGQHWYSVFQLINEGHSRVIDQNDGVWISAVHHSQVLYIAAYMLRWCTFVLDAALPRKEEMYQLTSGIESIEYGFGINLPIY